MSVLHSYQAEFAGGVLARLRLNMPVLAAEPGAPANGDMWLNSTDGALRVRIGGVTISLPLAGGAFDPDVLEPVFVDTATLNWTYNAGTNQMTAAVLDAPTLQGSTLAQVITAAVAAVVDTAPGTLDTLNELAAALGDDPNFAATILAALATKARTFEFTTAGGALTENVDHNLNTRDVSVQVYVNSGSFETEHYGVQRSTLNRVILVSEGVNIPAGRRVVVVAKGA